MILGIIIVWIIQWGNKMLGMIWGVIIFITLVKVKKKLTIDSVQLIKMTHVIFII